MKKLLATLIVLAGASPAFAYVFTTDMTCSDARYIVQREGAVVLYTTPYIYDRYVSSGAYCMREEITKPGWVPTSDSRHCFVGYRCVSRDPYTPGGR